MAWGRAAALRRAGARGRATRLARSSTAASGGSGGAGIVSPMSPEEYRRAAGAVADFVAAYQRDVGSMPVRSRVEPGYLRRVLPEAAPEEPEDVAAILDDVRENILPGLTHWQSPSFFAFFPANSSPASQLGEMLSAAFNVIGFSWIASPACTELETIALDWLADLLGLPEVFRSRGKGIGVIQGSASDATLVAVLAARAAATAAGAPLDRLVAYTSDQAHSSVEKACIVAGIPRANVRRIAAVRANDYAVRAADLAKAADEDAAAGLVPFITVATVGSTSSGAVDPVRELAAVARRHKMWAHVDAAWAGAYLVCDEYRALLGDGLDAVDSVSMNCHKALLVGFDCAPMWVRDRSRLVDALSATPEYLRNRHSEAGLVVDYKDLQVPLGRRMRALKLWFVLRSYGARQLREHVRAHVALAGRFEAHVRADPRFEIVVPRSLSLVCFRLRGADNDTQLRLLETVNATGRAFMIHTSLEGEMVLRFVVGTATTEERHVDAAWDLIREVAADIVPSRAPRL